MSNRFSTCEYCHLLRLCLSGCAAIFLLTGTVLFASREIIPRANQIAFESDQDGNWNIYLLDMRTNIVRNLSQNPADDYAPAWSPDGKSLIYYSDHNSDLRAELHILVPYAEAVKHALAIASLAVTREREVVVVEAEDRPGELADLARKVAKAGINLDLVYVATRNRVVFGADDIQGLREALGVRT